jgi:hypothetical protein
MLRRSFAACLPPDIEKVKPLRGGQQAMCLEALGDVLTFALRNDDTGWHDRRIQSLDIPGNRIIFPDVIVHVDSITMIRIDRKARGAQIIGSALQVGGINVMTFTAYEAIFRDTKLEWGAMAAGLLNVGVGTGIKRLFRRKVFRVGPWKKIRLLDLNFMSVPQQ